MPFPLPSNGSVVDETIKRAVNEFSVGFDRIANALGIETQLELADLLDIRQSSISDAKRRGVIPGEWALKLFKSHRLNPRWVYDGLLPVFLAGQGSAPLKERGGDEPSFLLKYPEGTLWAVRMDDASMEPSIRREAFVGVNVLERDIRPGLLLCVNLPLEGLSVRRIRADESAGLAVLTADNPLVGPQRMSLPEARERILGRVVWIMSPA